MRGKPITDAHVRFFRLLDTVLRLVIGAELVILLLVVLR
jgi:hypothetical protein